MTGLEQASAALDRSPRQPPDLGDSQLIQTVNQLDDANAAAAVEKSYNMHEIYQRHEPPESVRVYRDMWELHFKGVGGRVNLDA